MISLNLADLREKLSTIFLEKSFTYISTLILTNIPLVAFGIFISLLQHIETMVLIVFDERKHTAHFFEYWSYIVRR